MKRLFTFLVVSLLVLMLATVAFAKFPSKQITLVIQAAPGGASDGVSRTIAAEAQKVLGVPIVCINKVGAAGAIAMDYVAKSKPDGYTIGYVPVELSMLKALGYANIDPRNYDPIMRANILPAALTVKSDAPWNDINEFIAYAKAHPYEITVGTSGAGSIWHIAGAALGDKTGVKLTYVPFPGAAPSVASLMGGHIAAVTCSPGEVLSGVQGGKLKVLAVMGEHRSPLYPDVPTLKEKGIDVVVMAWGGFVLPKGVSQNVHDIVANAFKKAYDSESFKKYCKAHGIEPGYLPGDKFMKFAISQMDLFTDIINKLGLNKR